MWKAQKEKAGTSLSKSTKRPWRGGGTPAVNPTKRVAKQTPASCKHSKSVNNSTQKKRSGLLRYGQSTVETQVENDTTLLTVQKDSDQSQSYDFSPVHLCLSTSFQGTSNTKSEEETDQGPQGSDYPISSSLHSSLVSSPAEMEQDLSSRTVDGIQSIEPDQQLIDDEEDDKCDFTLYSSLETVPDLQKRQRISSLSTPNYRRHNQRSAGKGSVCKSSMKQVNHDGKVGERRSVKFTTPVRCSPRLAKVGEGSIATPCSTPKNKMDMR